ncbi:GYDIA family GHMP kinase [Bizionia gelidisalsuginis]|nr:GYDIA family GHMP kinase [Bizionia gelidisalsuginis]
MMQSFYSNGKLLITGEYVVLDGANAFALPTKLGQHLDVEPITDRNIIWTSFDEKGNLWFQDTFNIETLTSVANNSEDPVSKQLTALLKTAKKENPDFLTHHSGYKVSTRLDFPRDWGLGSSSTLINNLALWANVNPMTLLLHSFGGSGYDIACARHNAPILYQVGNPPKIKEISFNPRFKDELFFVHRNKKQNSRDAISTYKQYKTNSEIIIQKINRITSQLLKADSRLIFDALITEHEILIAHVTNQTPIKDDLFPDFDNAIKSLGGWGGDFILVTGTKAYVYDYFNSKNYNTIIAYNDLILGA